jgi:hypothetical protein
VFEGVVKMFLGMAQMAQTLQDSYGSQMKNQLNLTIHQSDIAKKSVGELAKKLDAAVAANAKQKKLGEVMKGLGIAVTILSIALTCVTGGLAAGLVVGALALTLSPAFDVGAKFQKAVGSLAEMIAKKAGGSSEGWKIGLSMVIIAATVVLARKAAMGGSGAMGSTAGASATAGKMAAIGSFMSVSTALDPVSEVVSVIIDSTNLEGNKKQEAKMYTSLAVNLVIAFGCMGAMGKTAADAGIKLSYNALTALRAAAGLTGVTQGGVGIGQGTETMEVGAARQGVKDVEGDMALNTGMKTTVDDTYALLQRQFESALSKLGTIIESSAAMRGLFMAEARTMR